MRNYQDKGINDEQAYAFLTDQLKLEVSQVALVGEGAWSRCFGFRRGAEELVVRFGKHVEDFVKDQRAFRYAAPGLPVPEVLDIGQAFEGYYAISSRVYGAPLERLGADAWLAVVPQVVDLLEALRTADVTATAGYGGWDRSGQAAGSGWAAWLLLAGNDDPAERTHGWRERLAMSAHGDAGFQWGMARLAALASDDVPRCLIHCDLCNRNVLVDNDQITGVFDWGCSLYGDHLYDLAWFEFWAPWHAPQDVSALRSALEQRWREVGYTPHNKEARLQACYLHIGLTHLAYNAYLEDWETLVATEARMRTLVDN